MVKLPADQSLPHPVAACTAFDEFVDLVWIGDSSVSTCFVVSMR